MPVSNVIGKLRDPFPGILSFLAQINRQQAFDYSAIGIDESTFGTVTGARKNFKPFIIGFIPPDVPINFLPFDKQLTNLAGMSIIQVNNADKDGFRDVIVPDNIPSYTSGPARKVPRTRTPVSGQDMRVAIARSYQTVLGSKPTEDQVALIYGQMVAELGRTPKKGGETFSTYNFNIGNSHTGTPGRFTPGPNGPWMGGKLKPGEVPQPGKTGPPPNFESVIDPSNPVKGSGRHYVFFDSAFNKEGVPVWYPTAYRAFDNLQDGMNHHVALLARKYPNALKATDPASFEAGLMDFGDQYHAANDKDPDFYQKNIAGGVANYKRLYGEKPLDGSLTLSGDPVESNEPPTPRTRQEIQSAIMTSGGFSGVVEDNTGDRIGRSVVLTTNAERIQVVGLQTDNVKKQIERIANIPPLLLLINPTEFSRQYQQSVDSSAKGRYGHIVHSWIEKPGSISSSGVTAAQYVLNSEGHGGLTGENRVYSLSYQNLLSLVGIYKNNGLIFSNNGKDGNSNGVPILTFSVFIYYDNNIYIGSFENISVKDDAMKPYNMSYDFTFNVRYEEPIDGMNFFDSSVSLNSPIGRTQF
jgi:hypothetical protein